MGILFFGNRYLGQRDSVFEGAPPEGHAPYEVHIRDSGRTLLARIERPLSWAYSRRLMEAAEISFVMPRELADELAEAVPGLLDFSNPDNSGLLTLL